ncbi:MAG TPA: DUF488 domain-containing protein [Edaphobacter sp.]|jgi:uncharacterized protein YeaO (DUF488 family)|nr:DUF488 domain-containing protein [Edaphobacter sp.]
MVVQLKRVYETPSKSDGTRILVDRLWPRGLTKEKAHVDLWLKEVAPSNDLRKWFAHDPAKWSEFKARYKAELKNNAGQLALLKQAITRGPATLLYGAKDSEHNEAVVLQDVLGR